QQIQQAQEETERRLAEAAAAAEQQIADASQKAEEQVQQARQEAEQQVARLESESTDKLAAMEDAHQQALLEAQIELAAEKDRALEQLRTQLEAQSSDALSEKDRIISLLQAELDEVGDRLSQADTESTNLQTRLQQLEQALADTQVAIDQRESFIAEQTQQANELAELLSLARSQRNGMTEIARQAASAHENLTRHTNRLGIILSNVLDLVKSTPRRPPEAAFNLDPQLLQFEDQEPPRLTEPEYPPFATPVLAETPEPGEPAEGEEFAVLVEEPESEVSKEDQQQETTTAPFEVVDRPDTIDIEDDSAFQEPDQDSSEILTEEQERQESAWRTEPTVKVTAPAEGQPLEGDEVEPSPPPEEEVEFITFEDEPEEQPAEQSEAPPKEGRSSRKRSRES
ncbi:MAG: hypothetical protein JW797_05550, partial [Bradymonadales bacterium]|nr:hypothetical protein [Bradymonadales bacterium]